MKDAYLPTGRNSLKKKSITNKPVAARYPEKEK